MIKSYFLSLSCVLCLLSITLPVKAQNLPQLLRPSPEPEPEPETLPPSEELLPPLEVPSEESPTPKFDIPGTIMVKQFEVIGSTIFSQAELAELLKPYTNLFISFAELIQAQESITQLYVDQGYITTGTFIPPQTLKDGIVKIEVVEGSVEKIEVKGLKRLPTSYITIRPQ